MATLSWPSVRTLCGIFCCPPFPSKIAAKLAFVPPTATYSMRAPTAGSSREKLGEGGSTDEDEGRAAGRMSFELTELAEWQFTDRELEMIEACTSVTSRGETIACIYVRTQPGARFTLLFSHGNAVDIGQMSSFLVYLSVQLKCDILTYDYSGYGRSTGRPTELNLYSDIDAAWDCLTSRYKVDPERIILYGQSIGTVPTIDLASRRRAAGVVLHSPLMSGMRIAFPETKQTWFFDAFPSIDKVERIESVVLVIHGTEDEVINIAHGRAIYARCPRTVEPLWVAGAGHNDIEHYDDYLQRLSRFLTLDVPTS